MAFVFIIIIKYLKKKLKSNSEDYRFVGKQENLAGTSALRLNYMLSKKFYNVS